MVRVRVAPSPTGSLQLWAIVAALPGNEALRRIDAAL
jgi:glutamyl/glutaminyl-tRNA synthetase